MRYRDRALRRLRVAGCVAGTCLALAVAPASAQPVAAEPDPFERVNRGIFWFNDRADVYALEPLARVWDAVLPDPAQHAVSRFFANLRFPVVAANDLLQGKFREAGQDVGRFLVNTTVGLAGLFDPATGWGLPAHDEDFGQTLGRWGVPPGPFLMLPLYGPSTPRDAVGMLVDWPLGVYTLFLDTPLGIAVRSVELLNGRSLVIEEVRDARAAALDYYVFVRNAYLQRRESLVRDGETATSGSQEEDLYYWDDEEE